MAELLARSFRFFDTLSVRVEGDFRRGAARGFLRKFKAYLVDGDLDGADLTFRVAPFEPRQGSNVRLFNTYRVDAGYLARTSTYKIARWTYDIAGLDSHRWTLQLDGNTAAHAMMHHLVMTPWLQLALSVRALIPVHAAAAVRPEDERGVVLAGRRGIGKTVLMGRLLRRGYHVVSEDRVFLKAGAVHGLRVPVNLKYDRHDPGLAALPAGVRRRLKRNALIAALTRGYIGLHEPVDLEVLLPDRLAPSCRLTRLVYLQSAPDLMIEDADAALTAHRIILGNRLDDSPTLEELLAYQFCFGTFAGQSDAPWERDEARLRAELSDNAVTLRRIMIPVRPTESQWDRVVEEMVG